MQLACLRPRVPLFLNVGTQKERQEKVRQHVLLDPAGWWDKTQDNKPFCQSKFLDKRAKAVPWLEDEHKTSWKLASWMDYAAHNEVSSDEEDLQVGKRRKTCKEEQLYDTVEELSLLVQRGAYVDRSLIYRVLKRCIAHKDLVLGSRVHSVTLRAGYESDTFLANTIIRMYATHGRLEEAMQVFANVAAPNTFIWLSLISAHVDHGQPTQAIDLYRNMGQSAVKPNSYVFVAVLKACAAAGDLISGKEVHTDLLQSALQPNMFVGSCLVDMYSKCGSLGDARRVFDSLPIKNVVIWNAMIAGYVQHGLGQEALTLYATMQQEHRTPADRVTFLCLLQACSSIGALHQGKQVHAEILKKGLEADVVVSSCLVDMYAKCGSLEDARSVFDTASSKNVVTWTSMIAGYVWHGLGQEALSLYNCMSQKGINPSRFTFSCLLKACANVGAIHEGRALHTQIQERGLGADMVVGNSLVDMYANCGSLEEARRVFDGLPSKDVVTWNALLNGYAHHGYAQKAMLCFQEMQQQGVQPDQVTFICLLVGCGHEGLVHEGRLHFKMMVEAHGIAPTIRHYVCMVDLLGRAGHLDDAESMLQTMPFENSVVGWTSLLTACKSHGDIQRGRRCFDRILALEPQNAVAYVLLGNMYASAGMWKDVDMVESMRKSAGAWKKAAKACIEVKNKVHEFTVGEHTGDVSSKVRSLNRRLKEVGGHVPQTELVLKAVSERQKEDELCGHAEKLALAYGLMNTPDGTTLLVTKNLRMCNDCHSGTKIMSRLEKREIIVRDAHRVHRFMDGSCSCGDWH